MSQDLARTKESRLEMTPMIDVTFLLLIFFMCTLRFKSLEGLLDAHLPQDEGVRETESIAIEKVEVVIKVVDAGTRLGADRKGPPVEGRRHVYGEDRVLQYSVGPYRTTDLEALGEKLERVLREKQPTMPMDWDTGEPKPVQSVVVPGVDTIHDDVMQVLDVLIEAGYEQVSFSGAIEG